MSGWLDIALVPVGRGERSVELRGYSFRLVLGSVRVDDGGGFVGEYVYQDGAGSSGGMREAGLYDAGRRVARKEVGEVANKLTVEVDREEGKVRRG